jgi:hypothetical protein
VHHGSDPSSYRVSLIVDHHALHAEDGTGTEKVEREDGCLSAKSEVASGDGVTMPDDPAERRHR